ncbi:MAG: hypothetical protein GX909_01725 [Clostridiaceae bacterium]|nr:hypothetical protein [Clostridiaceae bacterium]
MGLSLVELEKNTKLQIWYEEMKEKENSGMTVKEWCQYRGYSLSNFYKYQKKVRQAIDEKLNQMEEPTQFAALPIPKTENLPSHAPETSTKIILRQDNLELEIPDGISREIILALLEGLKC